MIYPSPLPPLLLYGLLLCLSVFGCKEMREKTDTVVPSPPAEEVGTFTNPVYRVGPDPWVFQQDSTYYVTYTTGRNITLIETTEMSGLNTNAASAKVIWLPPATGMNSKQIWAPEVHRIDGTWYVYYAASDGDNANHRMWVLSNDSDDPLTGAWEDRGELKLPDDKWAIDGSPVEIGDQRYFAWSGWEGDVNIRQNIYLAAMDSPTEVSGQRVRVLTPTDAWEKNGTDPEVTEGPQFLAHGDRMFMFYSAGGCWTDGYSIGALFLTLGEDPMDATNWSRLEANPLFTSNTSGGVFGPGHNSFFTSPDGTEDWILYHANPQSGQGCGDERSIRMQPFTWTADGLPDLGTPVALGQQLERPSGE
ncbi:family 43 glycosylhydrolase [Neolewinella sp.]|uniref:glycoside hydrolase family 43 protein n=1 Tax=Neolewinella sp. TaxID=2993543 RepID=UPI003B528C62